MNVLFKLEESLWSDAEKLTFGFSSKKPQKFQRLIFNNKKKINTYSCKLENYTVLESNINFVRWYIKQTPLNDSQMVCVTIGNFQSLSELQLYNKDKATNLTVQFLRLDKIIHNPYIVAGISINTGFSSLCLHNLPPILCVQIAWKSGAPFISIRKQHLLKAFLNLTLHICFSTYKMEISPTPPTS